ncbi:MAG: ribulokinase [Vicinamibacterales bacterium]|jgi:L-ribulokinase|nr:ribulokinase [Vicinamibacterales bacterium]MDP7471255.1 ribulokinase [Vicinamibacterales bacterium]|tara:strand:- start:463 stop:2118 length:1656 start_codon:yes stop_codon:yes gene_type:complete
MTMGRTPPPCAVGLDFGTASCRAVIVEMATGRQLATAVADYPHGVIDRELPGGGTLGVDWALQHPTDYLTALTAAVTEARREAGAAADTIAGIGIDFTASTVLPIDSEGQALCLRPEFAGRPHAWVKLWKHHAAQPQADRINEVTTARGERFLDDYGGRTSSEWLVAKALQILDEDPEIFESAAGIVEAADWTTSQLTGTLVRNACGAGYKGLWSRAHGFPPAEFFEALDPRMRDFVRDKLPGEIVAPGQVVGGLTEAWASRLELEAGTPVAAPIIDAHAGVLGATVVTPGRMVIVLGTSTCHMLLADRHAPVEGVAGIVRDGIVEGLYGYEAGQAAVGDIFGWFAGLVGSPASDSASTFARLETAAAATGPGGNGLVALDWWNGNRSVLANADLSGLIIGLSLQTTAGELYRSLIEATGFGTRRILDAFEAEQIPVTELVATGGLAERSPLLLRIYADITQRPIRLAASPNASALGAAILGALAAGAERGGHGSLEAAVEQMAGLATETIEPDGEAARQYEALYKEYLELHDHFGRGGSAVMSRLRRLRR